MSLRDSQLRKGGQGRELEGGGAKTGENQRQKGWLKSQNGTSHMEYTYVFLMRSSPFS
jgi:hypothetical protein